MNTISAFYQNRLVTIAEMITEARDKIAVLAIKAGDGLEDTAWQVQKISQEIDRLTIDYGKALLAANGVRTNTSFINLLDQ
jgi:hypothetical protein